MHSLHTREAAVVGRVQGAARKKKAATPLSALLHHRLAFIGAPGHRLGGGDALDRTRRRAEERSGVHTEAALQLLANPHGLRGFL